MEYDDMAEIGAPRCPRCLLPLEVVGAERAHWQCLNCGLRRLP